MKDLIIQAFHLKKVLAMPDYSGSNKKQNALEKALTTVLQTNIDKTHGKAKTLQKNLLKHQQHILSFLWHSNVSADNNGSEKAMRNLKVKQKILSQFKWVH